MDIAVVTGNRKIGNSDEFPETLTPFPEPTHLVYAHTAAQNLRPVSPPHKLRPIRSNARSPVDGDRVRFGSGSFVEGWEANCAESDSRLFSESSDNGNEYSSGKLEGSRNQKRKRKSSNLSHFLENMVNKVMEKQEQMHSQLIDTIEKMERDRIKREEAWRQMEMERLKKDEALRAQETSRSQVLVSFLQNLMGEEIQTPEPISQHRIEEHWVETDAQAHTNYDLSHKRWPEAEVQALITLRTTLDHKFCGTGLKVSIWEEISAAMSTMGYTRTAKKCKEKWENMNKYFRRLTENGKQRSSDKTCPYFHGLGLLYRTGVLNAGTGITSSGDDEDAKSERDSGSPETG